jgi:hypothetical protein
MKIYDEDSMGGLRELAEETLLTWPGVTKRPMFGTPGYSVGGRMFACMMQDSLTVKLPEGPFDAWAKKLNARAFTYDMGGEPREMKGWLRVPYTDEAHLDAILPAAKEAYLFVKAGGGGAKSAKKTSGKSAKTASKMAPKEAASGKKRPAVATKKPTRKTPVKSAAKAKGRTATPKPRSR